MMPKKKLEELSIGRIYMLKGSRVANLTPEELAELHRVQNAYARQYRRKLTEEKREQVRKKRREYMQRLKDYGQVPTSPQPATCNDCPFSQFRTYPKVALRSLEGWYCLDTRPMRRVTENECISKEITNN